MVISSTMSVEIPDRLWIPLLILKTTGPLHSKTKFQNIAFLAQHKCQINEYDFIKHHYGPYSDGLDLDTACYPSLIAQNKSLTLNAPSGHYYYSYHITDQGQELLTFLKSKINPNTITTMKNKIDELNEKPLSELLEEVYDKFILETDSTQLEYQVKTELSNIIPPISNSYEKFGNRQTTFVLAILEMIHQILSEAETDDTVQKDVIFNLSKEIIQKCKDLAKEAIPPTDSDLFRPQSLEINDLFSYLVQYCENRNIIQDPMKKPLEDILSENEAQHLSQTLQEFKLSS